MILSPGILSPFVNKGSKIDPDLKAYITAANITDATEVEAATFVFAALKGLGLYTKIRALWLYLGSSAESFKWNAVNPVDSDAAFRLRFDGTWTQNANGGNPDGATATAETFFNPSLLATTNNFSMFRYSRTNDQTQCDMGASNGLNNATCLYARNGADDAYYAIANSLIGITEKITDSSGFFAVSRINNTQLIRRRNGVSQTVSSNATSFANRTITLAGINSTSIADRSFRNQCFTGIGFGLTEGELAQLDFIADYFNAVVNRDVVYNEFDGTLQNSISMGGSTRNPFGQYEFTTTSTELLVNVNGGMQGLIPAYAKLTVFVDGAFYQEYSNVTAVAKYMKITLPAGSKTVKIVEGSTSKPSTTVFGTFINRIKTYRNNATITKVTPAAPATAYVTIGDSISNGDFSTVFTQPWNMKLRYEQSKSVGVYGYGWGSIYDYALDSAAVTATVGRLNTLLNGTASNKVIILIGTNDYGLNLHSAANFYTRYLALVDAIIALGKPGLSITLISPLLRSVETANTFGNTLGDYRTRVSDIATLRSLNFIDGTTIMNIGGTQDGLHPNATTGQNKLFDAVKNI